MFFLSSVFFLCFFLAVVTPPDVISQLALAVPMCILYELGIFGARWFSKVSAAPEETTERTDPS